jgi:predicted AAA+ superfamily ATPase
MVIMPSPSGGRRGHRTRTPRESCAAGPGALAISGFSLAEVGADAVDRLWRRGGFPPAYLARSDPDSVAWRKQFVQSLLERDLPQWGVRVPATALLRFWTMVAHYHGQIWNSAELARALGVNESTCRSYLDLLTDALVLRPLQPWHANLKKRQVKSPKVYVRDSGLLHQLLGVDTAKALLEHPKVGASWEGFVIEQVLATESHDEAWFWATHQGAEIDLLLRRGDQLYGVECKRADAPRMTPSMRNALQDLGLARIAVVYPGSKRYPIAERVEAVPVETLAEPGRLFAGGEP